MFGAGRYHRAVSAKFRVVGSDTVDPVQPDFQRFKFQTQNYVPMPYLGTQ